MQVTLKHCSLQTPSNIGTGDRDYFIVDRTKIVQDQIRYEVQARQSSTAVEGMACEDPLIFGYVVEDSTGTPATTYIL